MYIALITYQAPNKQKQISDFQLDLLEFRLKILLPRQFFIAQDNQACEVKPSN